MNKKVLAVIPARGGSKGVKGKNLKLLNGKPLIQHSLDVAKQSKLITDIVVSTDDDEIANFVEKQSVEVIRRPAEISGDSALVVDAIKHSVLFLQEKGREYDVVTLLEATSPLRSTELVDECLLKFESENVDSVATFCESSNSPNRLWRVVDGGNVEPYIKGAVPWLPRQKQPVSFELNGLVYAFSRKNLFQGSEQVTFLSENILAVVTKAEDSIDIDTEMDFVVAEAIMKWREL